MVFVLPISAPPSPIWVEILYFGISACYLGICIWSLVLFIQTKLNASLPSEAAKPLKLFSFLLSFQTLLRFAFFFIIALESHVDTIEHIPEFIMILLTTLPFKLFFTTYTILVYIWARVYYLSLRDTSIHKRLLIGVNVLLYIFQIIEYALNVVEEDSPNKIKSEKALDIITTIPLSALSILLALAFIWYGYKMIQMFGRNQSFKEGIKMVWTVGIISVLSFLFRGVMLLVMYFVTLHWLFFLLYVVPSEIIPSALMLYVYQRPSALRSSQHQSSLGGYTLIPTN